jgi:hypothetical protein
MRGLKHTCACVCSALLTACAGNGEGLDENGRPAEAASDTLVAEFSSIQRHVFTPVCTGCHSGASAPLGLRLDEGASFAMLVNAPSVEAPALNRVQPGNPDASYLIRKLEGTATVGGRMPLNAPPLPADTIAVIRQWIANGAMPSAASGNLSTDSIPSLDTVWPVTNMKLAAATREIVMSSKSELDTTLLTAGTVTLVRRTEDSSVEAVPASISIRSFSPTTFAVAIPADQWRTGTYELRVSGTAPLAVTDLDGRAIDGDADGAAGGDLFMSFVLE